MSSLQLYIYPCYLLNAVAHPHLRQPFHNIIMSDERIIIHHARGCGSFGGGKGWAAAGPLCLADDIIILTTARSGI